MALKNLLMGAGSPQKEDSAPRSRRGSGVASKQDLLFMGLISDNLSRDKNRHLSLGMFQKTIRKTADQLGRLEIHRKCYLGESGESLDEDEEKLYT